MKSEPTNAEPAYPRTYKIEARTLRAINWLVTAPLAGIFLWVGLHPLISGGKAAFRQLFWPGVLFGLLEAWIYSVLTRRVKLYQDGIEVAGWFTTRRLSRGEILGREHQRGGLGYGYCIAFVPKDETAPLLVLPPYLNTDGVFRAWIKTIPWAEEKRQPGRTKPLTWEKTAAQLLGVVSLILSMWILYFPRPYPVLVIVVAVLPLLAIALLVESKGLHDFEVRQGSKRWKLRVAVLFPTIALACRVFIDLNFLRLSALLIAASVGGLMFMGAFVKGARTQRRAYSRLFVVALMAAIYFYGALGEADVLLDRSVPRTYEAAVLGKYVSSGYRSLPSFHLRLGPWGPEHRPSDINVTPSVCRGVGLGQTVRVELRPGAVGVPWYEVKLGE